MDIHYFDIHTHRCVALSEQETILCSVEPKQAKFFVSQEKIPWFSCGIHPWRMRMISDVKEELNELKILLTHARMLAIGECGLDRCTLQPISEQIKIFEKQIELSEEYNRPLIIHCVRAYAELMQLYKSNRPQQPWIVHGFRGNDKTAVQLQNKGLYLSFGKRFHPFAFNSIDVKRILLETDDEKDFTIVQVYRQVAKVLRLSEEVLAIQIRKNVEDVLPCLTIF